MVRKQLVSSGLYGIIAAEYSLGRTNREVVALMLASDIRILQYRAKDKGMRNRYTECLVLRAMGGGGLLIVNDHPGLALAVKADGVHIGQDDLPLPVVRRLMGPGPVIGVSAHSPAQARTTLAQGADGIGVGPIPPSPRKTSWTPWVWPTWITWRPTSTCPSWPSAASRSTTWPQ